MVALTSTQCQQQILRCAKKVPHFPFLTQKRVFRKYFMHLKNVINAHVKKRHLFGWSVMCVFPKKNTFFVAQILYEEQPKRLVLIPQATSIILVMDSPIDISHPQLKAKRIYSRLQSAEILPYQSIVRMAMSMNGAAMHRNTYHFDVIRKIQIRTVGRVFLQKCFILPKRKSN